MRIKVLSGGRKSIELPLSDAELNFQMRRMNYVKRRSRSLLTR